MATPMVRAIPVALAASICMGSAATAQDVTSRQDKNRTITITYGRVVAVEATTLSTAAGGGAAVGGIVGLASAHGERNRDKIGTAAAGALLGAVLTRVAEGKRKAEAFTIQESSGATVKIIQDLPDIREGDCVSVEQGTTANVRRVSDAMCSPGPHLSDSTIQASHRQDADECAQAKQDVLAAKAEADFAIAERKVKILCD